MKRFVILVILLYAFLLLSEINAQELVVHPSVIQQEISRNTLRAIFGMRLRKWPDGRAIKVFVLKDDAPHHIEFSKSILHMFPYQLRRAWDRQVYSGTGQSPNEVTSLKEMLEKLANTPGAVGYLPIEEINENKPGTHLKVLHVR